MIAIGCALGTIELLVLVEKETKPGVAVPVVTDTTTQTAEPTGINVPSLLKVTRRATAS